MILDTILDHKREELAEKKRRFPLERLKEAAAQQPPPFDFAGSLRGGGISLIAEVKKASPSRGLLCPDFGPVRLALAYAAGGAAAVSVLTDERFFQGSLEDLRAVHSALLENGYRVPLLRKEFILDEYQVYESRAAGADAFLLIAAALSGETLSELMALAKDMGMAALVEVHNEEEAERVVNLKPDVVGINNRDLRDFSVDLGTFERLCPLMDGTTCVAESGIHTFDDVSRLCEAGADAVLIGEELVTATDVGEKIKELDIQTQGSGMMRKGAIANPKRQ